MNAREDLASLAAGPNQKEACAGLKAHAAPAKHGDKGDYVKLTVTLPPAVYELVMAEVTRKKLAKESEPVISALLRDAVLKHFSK